MERDALASKLQALTLKNKKLLESVSTHLITNHDELEVKYQDHKHL